MSGICFQSVDHLPVCLGDISEHVHNDGCSSACGGCGVLDEDEEF